MRRQRRVIPCQGSKIHRLPQSQDRPNLRSLTLKGLAQVCLKPVVHTDGRQDGTRHQSHLSEMTAEEIAFERRHVKKNLVRHDKTARLSHSLPNRVVKGIR
jgi:hypothetical protein